MVRDENDRPYEDGQGRPVNPDLTGDVLSPRWSTDDTDEQPAIQITPAGETYILPPETGRDVLDDLPQDTLSSAGQGQGVEPAYLPLDRAYDGPSDDDRPASAYDGDVREGDVHDEGSYGNGSYDESAYDEGSRDSGPHETRAYDGAGSYDGGSYDDGLDDERPRRGFLGSGWTDDSEDAGRPGRSEREGREGRGRTRMLVLAAVAVVVVGVGAGFALTGGSDDPCADGRCASAGQVSTPLDSAAADDEAEEETTEPAEEETTEPAETPTADASPTTTQARPTREPAARPTATRSEEPEARPSARPSRSQEPEMRDTDDQAGTVRDSQTEQQQRTQSEQRTEAEEKPTEEPTTQEPAPTPAQEERKGLFDYLFPWA
ncbi:hypothetical protein AB0K40_01380 [Nonomuraea bangladeshensis]|uniref:Uncharacterized protein n=1 Tax=Nonomuraea bangladeshensis TaxID=404385 RepID=A0ABV3GV48_9ACTN